MFVLCLELFLKTILEHHQRQHRMQTPCQVLHLHLPVFGTNVRHDVLVEELENEWDTVGKH